VKEFLSRAGRAFEVKNVDEDPEAFTEMVALGFMTIPVTILGDYVVRGYDEKRLREALAATDAG
jgi:glutaredoxin